MSKRTEQAAAVIRRNIEPESVCFLYIPQPLMQDGRHDCVLAFKEAVQNDFRDPDPSRHVVHARAMEAMSQEYVCSAAQQERLALCPHPRRFGVFWTRHERPGQEAMAAAGSGNAVE
jgi:hypothetical protein